jgi:hypothetical protein
LPYDAAHVEAPLEKVNAFVPTTALNAANLDARILLL